MKMKHMVLCSMFSALLAICAWIAFPLGDVAITLQTFGVFLCLGTLGGKQGTISILVYLLLGSIGLPVFSGFRGGLGALLGTTGGYLTGFLFSALLYWLMTALCGNGPKTQLTATAAGLLICYIFGSLWYYALYVQGSTPVTIGFIIIKCILPYVLPDIIKLILAWQLSRKLRRFVY